MMIDKLHSLIGNTARFATPKEAEMILHYHEEMLRHQVTLKDLTNKKNRMLHLLKMRSGEKTPRKEMK
ncbi:MAG: hypothetical protein AAB922_02700 [Patescibacteria group bacterium]